MMGDSTPTAKTLRFIWLLAGMGALAVSCRVAVAQTNESIESSQSKGISSGPYCGVYSLYTLLKLQGEDVDIRSLLKPEYIGSPEGSSISELMKAAEDHGFSVVSLEKLTAPDLRDSPHPLILYVKAGLNSEEYDHYELFLGWQDGKALLYDPPRPRRWEPWEELAPRWSRIAIVVSKDPIDTRRLTQNGRKRLILWTAVTIALVLIIRRLRPASANTVDILSFRSRLRLAVLQFCGVSALAFIAPLVFLYLNPAGLISNTKAVAAVKTVHFEDFLKKLNAIEVRRLLNSDVLLIDARWEADYIAGHIKGAINLSPDSTLEECRMAMEDIPRNMQVIVYCQSAGCSYAGRIAGLLASDGYTNVALFKGGWVDWVKRTAVTSRGS